MTTRHRLHPRHHSFTPTSLTTAALASTIAITATIAPTSLATTTIATTTLTTQASAGMSEAALAGLEPAEVQLATWLASDGGQSHLLTGWEEAAVEDKRRLLAQVTDIVEKYTPVRVRARLRPLTSLYSYTSTETRCSRIPRPKLTILQVAEMDEKYPSDAQGRRGLSAYVAHAKELLAESAADKNPFEGYAVEVPEGERMAIGSDAFRADERAGMAVAQDTV